MVAHKLGVFSDVSARHAIDGQQPLRRRAGSTMTKDASVHGEEIEAANEDVVQGSLRL